MNQLDSPLVGPHASTGYWLKLAAQAWQCELDAALRPLRLTTAQFSVLAGVSWLNRGGGPPNQQQVADFAGTDRMMTSKLLQNLEARSLLTRSADPDDARTRRIQLTAIGRELIRRSTQLARQVDAELFDDEHDLRDVLRSWVVARVN